jgi:hypothetical protein
MTVPACVAEFLESEHVLSSQFFASAADTDTPEKALMRAVLERALVDLADPKFTDSLRAKARIRREAEAWFLSDDTTWPYSFINLCGALNLDTGALRTALLSPERKAA